jgi:hypothetical protein
VEVAARRAVSVEAVARRIAGGRTVRPEPRREVERTKERLGADEPHRGRRFQEEREALVGALLVLGGDADPEVGKRPALWWQVGPPLVGAERPVPRREGAEVGVGDGPLVNEPTDGGVTPLGVQVFAQAPRALGEDEEGVPGGEWA